MPRFRLHPSISDRYRITLTLPEGVLMTYETASEEDLSAWIDSQKHCVIHGRLIQRITTLVIE